MRKLTSFLMLLVAFVLTGASASAQNSGYKPGVRKTTFIQGETMFIYNTAINGSQDRTGFYRYVSGKTDVQLVKQKPFASSDKYRYDVNGTSIWTIASLEIVGTNDAPVYKMSITNSAGQYLKYDMTYSNDVQYVYVRSWANTASGKRESVKSEAADGAVIENANITDSHKVWTVSQNEDVSTGEFWNGNVESVAKYSKAHPFAFYTTVEMTEEELSNVRSALATTKTNIVSGIETVLNDCGVSVTLTPMTLTTDNTTSNAEHNIGKPSDYATDGTGIAGLIDKTGNEPNLNTYFHSRWAGTAVDGGYHYIQVNAGKAISAFAFGYSTRNGGEQHPTAFDIYGSSDGTSWTKIASIDKETFALKGTYQGATETYAQRGFVLPSGTTYQHFRFAVTANTSGTKFNGYPIFALADFNFSEVEFSCNESYKQNASVLLNNYLLKQEVAALVAGVTDPESAVLTTARNMVANQFFADASKQPALPFTLSTSDKKQNYHITTRGGMYYSLRPWESGKIYLDASSEIAGNNAYRYWYFTRSELSGAIYIHPVTEPTEMVGFTNTEDGNTKIFNKFDARVTPNRKFCYVLSGSNKCFRPFGTQTYISNHGGSGNAMGFYNDATDGGTKVEFIAADALPDNIVALSEKYLALRSAFSTLPANELIGTELNQYNQSQVEKVNSAESMLKTQAGNLTTETIANYLAGATFTTLEMNQPAPNGFYRFRNVRSNKYLTTTLTGSKMTMAAAATSAAIFYLTSDNKLVGYDNGFYTQHFDGNYGFQDASGTGNVVTFPNGNTYAEATACYHINRGNRSIYGNGATLDAGRDVATNHTDTGYDWTIEAVTALPLTIGQVGWSTFYAPVPVTIPDGVTAYIAGIESNICTLTEVTGTVPANTGLILYKQDGGNVEMTIAESGSTNVTGNALVGGTNTVNRENGYIYYALQRKSGDDTKVGLYPYTTPNGTLKGFRAFYRAASESSEANVAGFSFDTIITGIDGILGTDGTNDGKIYDLSGRRLNKPVKGLNIIGGKKVLVK